MPCVDAKKASENVAKLIFWNKPHWHAGLNPRVAKIVGFMFSYHFTIQNIYDIQRQNEIQQRWITIELKCQANLVLS